MRVNNNNKQEKATKAVILCRVSSKEQEEGYSIDAQKTRLQEYCKRKELEIINEFIIVESSTRGDRPKFYEMIKFIKKQKGKIALVCDKVDRLQRSFKEVPILDELRRSGKLEMHFHVEGQILDEKSNSSQIMMYQFFVMMAENFANQISDNVTRSFEKIRAEGRIVGNAPIGYLNCKDKNGKSDVKLDSERAILVKRMFEEYATGLYSLKALRTKTIEWNLKNKTKANGYLSISQIDRMLKNKFYCGIIETKGIQYHHIYPILVPKELWDKCENVRLGKHKVYAHENKNEFIFRGLITCKNCGCLISPEIKKGKYIYLRPISKKPCTCKQINEKEALKKVEHILGKLYMPEEYVCGLKDTLKKSIEAKGRVSRDELSHYAKSLGKVEQNIENSLMRFVEGNITKEEHQKLKYKLNVEYNNIQKQMSRLKDANDEFEITVEYLVDLSSRSYSLFQSSDIDTKRKILKIVFSNFFLNGAKVEYKLNRPFDMLVKWSTFPETRAWRDSNPRPFGS